MEQVISIIEIFWPGIAAILGTILSPLVIKIISSKEFRTFFFRGLKNLFKHFSGKGVFTHYLFISGNLYNIIANNITFENSCDKKNKLFRTLLNTITNVVLEELKNWVIKNKKKITKFNVIELQTEFYQLVHKIVNKYETDSKEAYFQLLRDCEESEKMFNIIYYGNGDEDRGFKDFHQHNVDRIMDFIKDLPTYVGMNNHWMVSALLSEFDTALRTAIRDTKAVFEAKNGRLCE